MLKADSVVRDMAEDTSSKGIAVLAINMLAGGHGDALIIEYGTTDKTYRVLVDGGTLRSWETTVRPALLGQPDERFETFIVTHVDEDHIGGAIKLLDDPDLRHRVHDVWFNGYVHCSRRSRDDVLGPIDGERLTYRIAQGQFRWNAPFAGPISGDVGGPVVVSNPDELPTICLPGGAIVYLLSPTRPKLDELAEVWKKVVEKAGLDPAAGTPLEARQLPTRVHTASPLPAEITVESLTRLAKSSARDRSEANGSSIAFVFEYDGHRALLGADATADVLLPSLRTLAKSMNTDRVPLDLVKLPHHGSKANVPTALIKAIDAENYLVSTNGDNHGHPDNAAIARVVLSSTKRPTFFCNYRTDGLTDWAERASAWASFEFPAQADGPGLRVAATEKSKF